MSPDNSKRDSSCVGEEEKQERRDAHLRSNDELTQPLQGQMSTCTQDAATHIPTDAKDREELLTPAIENDVLGPVEDTFCGLGKLRGRYLQKLAHPVTYLFISSVVALVQGMFFTYSNATLSTVEKRFRLPSKVSGFTTTGNDLVQLLLSVHLTYIAGQGHRPRWLAFGMLGATLGCVLAATPHFLFGEGDQFSSQIDKHQSQDQQLTAKQDSSRSSGLLCGLSNTTTVSANCNDEGGGRIGVEQYTVVTLLLLAQMLAGLASMLYYTVGYSYLDEAVSKDRVPLFLSVSGSLRIMGPVCGYSMAAWSLSYWVNPSQPPDLSPKHPGWIGAWWIGYLVIGTTLLIITWSLLLLPKTLPGARKRALVSLRSAAKKGQDFLEEYTQTLRPAKSKGYGAMCPSVRRILTNKVYVLITINQIFFWFAFFGYITFKPKYLEHQFKMSAAKANQYIAGAAMAATLVGWLGTGAALTFFRPCAKFVICFMAILSTMNSILHLCMVNVSCDHDKIYGMDLVIQDTAESQQSSQMPINDENIRNEMSVSECFSRCGCSFKFSPVCADGIHNFYNPCFAGCTSSFKRNKSMVYENCVCTSEMKNTSAFMNTSTSWDYISKHKPGKLYNYYEESNDTTRKGIVVDGYCSHNCSTFYMYLALTVLTKMTHAASRVPVNLILFRCVEERDKDMGLGIFNAALALFSSIPAPIIFGWAIDYACQLWQNTCGQQGFCWLYDLNMYRYILHGIPAGLMAGCLITELILLSLHKSIYFYGKDESEASLQQSVQEEEEVIELKSEAC